MKTVPQAGKSHVSEFISSKEVSPATDLKGSVFTLTVLRIHRADFDQIERELSERIAKGPRFFEDAPVVIDVDPLRTGGGQIDLRELAQLLQRLRLIPVGVRHANLEQQQTAREVGLALMKGGSVRDLPPQPASTTDIPPAPAPANTKDETPEPLSNTVVSVKGLGTEGSPDQVDSVQSAAPTKVIYQSIRSGQQVYARGADLIVIGGVNAGAEVVADGNVHIYGSLRGRALAGAQGNVHTRIFCQCLEAELVAVAGQYRVFDDGAPDEIRGQTVQVFLVNNQLRVERLR